MEWDDLAASAAFPHPSLPSPHSMLLTPPGSKHWHFPSMFRAQSISHQSRAELVALRAKVQKKRHWASAALAGGTQSTAEEDISEKERE